MIPNKRQSTILMLLKKETRISVKKLAKELYVSEMTIRRDLRELEQCGYLQRYNGGAIACPSEGMVPISERKLLHSKEKSALAKQVRVFLRDSLTVFIDSSSTCMYVIPLLAEYKNVKIVTNSVQSLLLAAQYHIPCMVAGGDYFVRDMCMVGCIAEDTLRNINVDVAFLSSLGIGADGVISDTDEQQTAVRKVVLKNAAQTVFLFDQSKQNKKYLYTLCTVDDADAVIMQPVVSEDCHHTVPDTERKDKSYVSTVF